MSNRKRRLLRKLANLPVSEAERKRRARQRLITETEQRMMQPLAMVPAFAAVTKEEIDRLVKQMADAAMLLQSISSRRTSWKA